MNLRYSHPYYTLFDRIIKYILLNYKTKRGFLNLTSFTLYFIFVCLAKISLENFWTCNKSIFCSHSLLWQTTKINRVKVSSRLLWKKNPHQNLCSQTKFFFRDDILFLIIMWRLTTNKVISICIKTNSHSIQIN